ncbi:MAG TPA: nucleoside permease [Steroidobacteraceae bacterium]|nr:nucleoside permease [Steroidobacteraceae bacterium]
MTTLTRTRLCVMMFLQFFVWGGWFVTMGSYLAANLHASGAQTGLAYGTQALGAIIAPFIVGLIADRYFNAERVLGVLHLAGGCLMYVLYGTRDFAAFYPLLLAYMLLYMPTLALVNAVAFRQMADPARHFSGIRVWGTIGWIVAGLVISYLFAWDSHEGIERGLLRDTFLMCALASGALGLYSFTLPATPPLPAAQSGSGSGLGRLLGFDALVLLKERNFAVFFAASVLICIPLAFYYQNANQFLTEIQVANATGKQTIGQGSEVLFMLLIPVFLRTFGMKATLLVGMLAWAARYVLFALGDAHALAFLLIIGIALHGVCYDFFFVSGQIYTDSKAGPRHKAAAQGLITLATYGLGMLVGFWAAGRIDDLYASAGAHDWKSIWLYPAVFAAGVFLLFALTFRNEKVAYAGR